MKLQELQKQALQLPISDRWRLIQSLLSSIQQETLLALDAVARGKVQGYVSGHAVTNIFYILRRQLDNLEIIVTR